MQPPQNRGGMGRPSRSLCPVARRTTGCRRRQTASARTSLPLFAAPEPQRSATTWQETTLQKEDAAHAHGSTLNGQAAGTFGLAGAFSFYPTKLMTTGEGGMITTNDEDLARRARVFRDQGKAEFGANYHVELGYNWRLTELSAVLGLHQLRQMSGFLLVRRRIANLYNEGIKRFPSLIPLDPPPSSEPNYYKFVCVLKEGLSRSKLKDRLKREYNVSLSGEVYEIPCHLQPVSRDLQIPTRGTLGRAEDLCARHVCLPIYSDMTDHEAHYVLDALERTLS